MESNDKEVRASLDRLLKLRQDHRAASAETKRIAELGRAEQKNFYKLLAQKTKKVKNARKTV